MKPSCEIVEYASTRLISFCATAIVAAKMRRERADEGHDCHRLWIEADEREHADDRVHARRNHRRRMDHRADRGRTFHRVRQPDVQRELRRFADRPDEEQQTDQACRRETKHTARNSCKCMQNFFGEDLTEGKCAGCDSKDMQCPAA